MVAFALRYWRPLLAIMFAAALFGRGYAMGRHYSDAVHERAAAQAETARARALSDLAAAEQRARILTRELEDAAHAEPVQSPTCLPRSRVLRLNSR